MSDLTKRLVLQRVKPSGKVYDEVPVEPVGTLMVSRGGAWVAYGTAPANHEGVGLSTLPPGKYLIVEADNE